MRPTVRRSLPGFVPAPTSRAASRRAGFDTSVDPARDTPDRCEDVAGANRAPDHPWGKRGTYRPAWPAARGWSPGRAAGVGVDGIAGVGRRAAGLTAGAHPVRHQVLPRRHRQAGPGPVQPDLHQHLQHRGPGPGPEPEADAGVDVRAEGDGTGPRPGTDPGRLVLRGGRREDPGLG